MKEGVSGNFHNGTEWPILPFSGSPNGHRSTDPNSKYGSAVARKSVLADIPFALLGNRSTSVP